MTTPLAFRANVVAGIAAAVPVFNVVAPHYEAFSLESLKRLAVTSPACYVTCLGWPTGQIRGGARGDVHAEMGLAAYVVAKDVPAVAPATPAVPRGDQALTLSAAVYRAVMMAADWGSGDAAGPTDVRVTNHHRQEVDRIGVALWAVTWRQLVKLDALAATTLADFNTAVIDWQLQPNVHPDDPAIPPETVIDATDTVTP